MRLFYAFQILNITKGKILRNFSILSSTFSKRKLPCCLKMLKKSKLPTKKKQFVGFSKDESSLTRHVYKCH